jgi:predicted transcriptional regulator
MNVSEQLRKAIHESGLTRAEIARQSGVPESALSRFVVSGLELRSGSIDKVCKCLGLKLVSSKARKKEA